MRDRSLLSAVALAAATIGSEAPRLSIGGVTKPLVTLPRTRGSAQPEGAREAQEVAPQPSIHPPMTDTKGMADPREQFEQAVQRIEAGYDLYYESANESPEMREAERRIDAATAELTALHSAALEEVARLRAAVAEGSEYPRWIEHVERIGDMSPDDCLQMFRQQDGDIVVGMYTEKGGMTSVEFCAIGSGGGRSPHTRRALAHLMVAMERDNAESPTASQQPTEPAK